MYYYLIELRIREAWKSFSSLRIIVRTWKQTILMFTFKRSAYTEDLPFHCKFPKVVAVTKNIFKMITCTGAMYVAVKVRC